MKRVIVALALCVAAGCGGGGGGGGGGGQTPEQACSSLGAAYCNKLNTCAPLVIKLVWGDSAACASRFSLECVPTLKLPDIGVTTAMYSACARDLGGASCNDVFSSNLPANCLPQAGKRADGAACGNDSQCMSTYCMTSGSCGKCGKPATEGSKCDATDCARGLDCNSAQVCVKPGGAGSPCDDNRPCQTSLVCFKATCSTPVAAGQPCDPARMTTPPCDSLAGTYCNTQTKVCTSATAAAPGAPCGLVGGAIVLCAASGRCKTPQGSTMGTCLAAAADGAACDESAGPSCLSPAECSGGKCTLPNPASCM